jgi:hypothetical protein
MAKLLTQSHVKALHDKLGAELAEFFADAHGVEGDDDATETDDDEKSAE